MRSHASYVESEIAILLAMLLSKNKRRKDCKVVVSYIREDNKIRKAFSS